jgi:hypothetical protein
MTTLNQAWVVKFLDTSDAFSAFTRHLDVLMMFLRDISDAGLKATWCDCCKVKHIRKDWIVELKRNEEGRSWS